MSLLHPALLTLLGMRARGSVRGFLRELRAIHAPFLVLFWLGILVVHAELSARSVGAGAVLSPTELGDVFRSGMLTLALVGQIHLLGERAVHFTPGEADFLFSGPFNRYELVIYHVLASLGGMLVMSVILAVLLADLGAWFPAALIGAFLSFLFLHLLAMCLATLRETVEARVFALVRGIVVACVIVFVIGSLIAGVVMRLQHGAPGILGGVYGTSGMQTLLLPFTPFAEVVTAQAFDLSTLGWCIACLSIDAAALLALIRLDADNQFAEEALSRRDRRRSQGSAGTQWQTSPVMKRRPLSCLAYFKGAGALACLQITTAARGYRRLASLALVVLVIAGFFLFYQGRSDSDRPHDLQGLLYLTLWATVVISNVLRFDFRGNPQSLEYLKTLPVPAFAVCAGQLVTPVLLTLAYQSPFLMIAMPELRLEQMFGVLVLAVPLNTIWYALENLGFLIYPASQFRRGFGDVRYLGRQVFMLVAKAACVVVGALFAVLLSRILSGPGVSPMGMVWIVAVALFAESLLIVGVMALALKRFDPSRLQPSGA